MAETDKGNLTETQRAIYKQAKQQKKKKQDRRRCTPGFLL